MRDVSWPERVNGIYMAEQYSNLGSNRQTLFTFPLPFWPSILASRHGKSVPSAPVLNATETSSSIFSLPSNQGTFISQEKNTFIRDTNLGLVPLHSIPSHDDTFPLFILFPTPFSARMRTFPRCVCPPPHRPSTAHVITTRAPAIATLRSSWWRRLTIFRGSGRGC